MGIEPTTYGLGGRRSTFELHGLQQCLSSVSPFKGSFSSQPHHQPRVISWANVGDYNLEDLNNFKEGGNKANKKQIIFICPRCQLLLEQIISKCPLGAMSNAFTRKKIENYSYGLNDVIGKGYSSQVYKGRNDETSESVAVKVIDMRLLKNDINKILLESEILILKELKSQPHVLTLHEVFTTKNNTYIITELCESDLSKLVKKGLTEQQACGFMQQILTGYLNFARKQIIHRDLKPANILITESQELKIADFGFAIKAIDAPKSNKYNVGSPLYMAPQSLKKNEYTLKTDVWALGVIFFEMLTGQTPWKAKNEKQLLKKIESEKIDDILMGHHFSQNSKEFLRRTLKLDKISRVQVEELRSLTLGSGTPNILMEKKLNINLKPNNIELRNHSLISPKIDKSVDNRLQVDRNSENRNISISKDQSQPDNTFRYESINQSLQLKPSVTMRYSPSVNVEMKKKENQSSYKENPDYDSIYTPPVKKQAKEDKKLTSKIVISEIHFCRFLFKLLTRIKESMKSGLLQYSHNEVENIIYDFTGIIKHKIENLINFKTSNIVSPSSYEEYKDTNDYTKLMKIAKEYKERYYLEMKSYWTSAKCSFSTDNTVSLISFMQRMLQTRESEENFTVEYSKDIIILDYLMTSKQLIDIFQNGQNYERFARKSRIEQIVEGKTAEISWNLYTKIMARSKQILGVPARPALTLREERAPMVLA